MKPFNLEEYLANPNKKVVTRDGRNVRIICTNYASRQPIIAQIENANFSESFTEDGKYYIDAGHDSQSDLFFLNLEKKVGWVNIFEDFNNNRYAGTQIFKSREDAEKKGKTWNNSYITTIKIEWEE